MRAGFIKVESEIIPPDSDEAIREDATRYVFSLSNMTGHEYNLIVDIPEDSADDTVDVWVTKTGKTTTVMVGDTPEDGFATFVMNEAPEEAIVAFGIIK